MASFYKIQISNVSGYPQNPPNDGFIDNTTVEQYVAIDDANGGTLSLEAGLAGFTLGGTGPGTSTSKARANARYHNLLLQLNKEANIIVSENAFPSSGAGTPVSTIVKTGSPDYNVEPASIALTVMVEHNDSSLQTWDELNPGTLLTGTAALTRFVVRALTSPPVAGQTGPASDVTLNLPVYDPTPTQSKGATASLPRYGTRIMPVDVGPVVYGGTAAANYTAAASLVTITNLVDPYPQS